MFSNPVAPSSSLDEGVIVQVDVKRRLCKVKTLRGQNLDRVQWTELVGASSRGGGRKGPMMGDRVALIYGLGYPLIFGFLPKLQTEDNRYPLHIDTGQAMVDTGDYSPSGALAYGDVNKPGDLLNGDQILSSEGGGFIGALRAGSVLIRSSRLAEILLSKLDDVVKIISRNFEHYTDVSSDIIKNFKGRVYRYIGYSHLFSEARQETYRYHQYFGDVAAAEAVKTNYLSPPSSIPAVSSIIFKEQVTDGSEKMHRTVSLTGEEELVVNNGSTISRRLTNGSQTIISFNDQNTITVNSPVIRLQRADGAIVTLDSTGVHLQFQGATTDLKADGVYNSFGGHFMNITSGGVQIG